MSHVLITAGATREPLDLVRFLSNLSTGSTGAALAEALARRGHRVTLLRGEGSRAPMQKMKEAFFGSAADLETKLQALLAKGDVDAVLMCAAVADYRPAHMTRGKIRSDAASLTLRLVRNPKILPKLKSFSPSPVLVVGFKLTVGAGAKERSKAVFEQFKTGCVDVVIQNDLEEIRSQRAHPFRLFIPGKAEPRPIAGAARLAQALSALIGRGSRVP